VLLFEGLTSGGIVAGTGLLVAGVVGKLPFAPCGVVVVLASRFAMAGGSCVDGCGCVVLAVLVIA